MDPAPGRRMHKVAALVTRRSTSGEIDVVVFDHPLAGTQLPAGTVELGEAAEAGALREGWEETGVPRLSGARCLATLAEDDVVRHVFQLWSDAPMPDEWWVVTPDGGGLCWRCRWVPAAEDAGLVGTQAGWLTGVRDRLVTPPGPPPAFEMPDHPALNKTSRVMFWAFPGVQKRFVVTWLDVTADVPDELVRRAHSVCRTADGLTVMVSGNGRSMWGFPGGGREEGETVEQAAVREIAEEACADVTRLRPIGFEHILELDDDGRAVAEEVQVRFAADIDLRPWAPEHEISTRRAVTFDEARALAAPWWEPAKLDLLLSAARSAFTDA